MPDWAIWAIVAALLVAGEIATPGLFFLGVVAPAAVLALLVALLGGGLALQLAAFVVLAAVGLVVLRPLARRHLRLPPVLRSGVAALSGAHAVVLEEVSDRSGTVRIGGDVWTARPYVEGEVFESGAAVDVVEIDGATARVMR